ncbi:MAG: hypothetical protein PHH01_04375 [Patescibacteria group bacterium]|nr:hypothetical protein [Patescibacteria group bacterium]MDD5567402.1 hypothetical protein [Patescibacteria group bacterium]
MPKAQQEIETKVKTPTSTRVAKAVLVIFTSVLVLSIALVFRIFATNIR